MPENDPQSCKKPYRVFQPEGKISWRIEELWDGGVGRGPYGNRETAIRHEEEIAKDNGFIDSLVLQEAAAVSNPAADAFTEDESGAWHCVNACAIEMENKEIVFSKGMSFQKGTPFMGVDVAKWLDENVKGR